MSIIITLFLKSGLYNNVLSTMEYRTNEYCENKETIWPKKKYLETNSLGGKKKRVTIEVS